MIAALLALALAQESVPAETLEIGPMARRLPTLAVEAPFATTHVQVRQGAALLTVADYRIPGLGQFDLQMAGGSERLEVQVAPARRWAILGRLTAQVVAGVNLDSVFINGVDSGLTGELTGRYVIVDRPKAVLTGRVVFLGTRGAGLTPAPLADAFTEDRWDTVSAVLQGNVLDYVLGRRRSLTGGLGLSSGFDLGKSWGLQASLTFRVGSVSYLGFSKGPVDRTTRTVGSGGVAVDWTPKGKIPLGGQIEVHDRQEQEGWLAGELRARGENRTFAATTLAYTGRDDLHIGLSFGALVPALRASEERLLTVDVAARYDF